MNFLEKLDNSFGGIIAIVLMIALIGLLSYNCGSGEDSLKADLAERYNEGFEDGVESVVSEYGWPEDARSDGYAEGRSDAVKDVLIVLDQFLIDDPILIAEISMISE